MFRSWLWATALTLVAILSCSTEGTEVSSSWDRMLEEEGLSVDWAQARRSPRKTAYNPFETAITSSNVLDLQVIWSEVTGFDERDTRVADQLIAHSGRVFVATGPTGTVALDAESGTRLWEQTTPTLDGTTPGYLNAQVYVRTAAGFTGLSNVDGEPQVTVPVAADEIVSAPLFRDFDEELNPGRYGAERSRSSRTGELLYYVAQNTTTGAMTLHGVPVDGPSDGSGVPALEVSLGDAPSPSVRAFSDPSYGRGEVFFQMARNRVRSDGSAVLPGTPAEIVYHHEVSTPYYDRRYLSSTLAFTAPAVRFAGAYVVRENAVVNVGEDDRWRDSIGESYWGVSFTGNEKPVGAPVVTDDAVVVMTHDAVLRRTWLNRYELDRARRTHRSLTLTNRLPVVGSSIVGAGDLIYAPVWDGTEAYLFVFRASDLTLVERRDAGGALLARSEFRLSRLAPGFRGPFGEPIVTNGRVYLPTPDGVLALGVPTTDDGGVFPKVECVAERAGGGLTAWFSYTSENASDVTIAAGASNALSPADTTVALPTTFELGRHRNVFSAGFAADGAVTWTLTAPDGETRTATADAGTRRCPPQDGFGIRMLYPTLEGGMTWAANWDTGVPRSFEDDDPADPWFDPDHGDATYYVDGAGVLQATGETPRMYVRDPEGEREWTNVEITSYFRRVDDTGIGYGGLIAYARSNHGVSGPELENLCDTRGLGGRFRYDGFVDFEKETRHPESDFVLRTRVFDGGMPFDQWFGVKHVVFDLPDGRVRQELWLDRDVGRGGGNWERLLVFEDDGTMFGDGKTPCADGIDPALPLRNGDRDGSESGKPNITVYFRTDGVGENGAWYRWTSVREIDPPNVD